MLCYVCDKRDSRVAVVDVNCAMTLVLHIMCLTDCGFLPSAHWDCGDD